MKHTAAVVIIGGGIQGISLAYHLARRGVNDVCLVEMNTLGSGSSGRSAAVIGLALQTEECLPLAQWSLAALKQFEGELDTDPGYEPIGCLLLASQQGIPALERRHTLLAKLGVESHMLGHDAILDLTPGLNLEDIETALYCPNEGCIDPHSIMMAYAGHARRLGVTFLEGTEATSIQFASNQVTGVGTSAGLIATPCLVNAAGFRARQVAAWAGMDLPIVNTKRHLIFTAPVATYSRSIPFTYETGVSWYMRREGPGLLIGMGTTETEEEDPQVDWAFVETIIEHSMHRAPSLAQAGIQTAWAGLRSLTPDDNPILGLAEPLEGFFNDCGWGGHGIMHAPAAGYALAEWIVDGQATEVDVGRFGASRFARGSPLC